MQRCNSNIGTRDNPLSRLSSKEAPPAFGFGGIEQQRDGKADVGAGCSARGGENSTRTADAPGPASYRPQALTVLISDSRSLCDSCSADLKAVDRRAWTEQEPSGQR
eukprot:750636-Hanusia_phi.AAC.1